MSTGVASFDANSRARMRTRLFCRRPSMGSSLRPDYGGSEGRPSLCNARVLRCVAERTLAGEGATTAGFEPK
jgi:hypothetical protein